MAIPHPLAAAEQPIETRPGECSRAELAALRRRNLHRIVAWAWRESRFYRSLYEDHGIREPDLGDLGVEDLPIISKDQFVDHFDDVATDPRLNSADLAAWMEQRHGARELFAGEYVVMTSSGTSGRMGVYAYDRAAWGAVLKRMELAGGDGGTTRIGYFAATHGRFAGSTLCACLAGACNPTLFLSILDPRREVARSLDRFRPQVLIGYASTLAVLAALQLSGDLDISPRYIMVSGDPLTDPIRRRIDEAWQAPLVDLYAASESVLIAVHQAEGRGMKIVKDLNFLEVVDERDRALPPGRRGRLVLTNLYNRATPILRYRMDDRASLEPASHHGPRFLSGLYGRDGESLPIRCDDGRLDTLHPIVLAGCGGFTMPELESLQFLSRAPDQVHISYTATADIDSAVRLTFERLLASKGASATVRVTAQRVADIPNDARTGKARLVLRRESDSE